MIVRALDAADRGYCLFTWREGHKKSPGASRVPWSYYRDTFGYAFEKVLDDPTTRLLGAYTPEGKLIGWLAMTPGKRVSAVHWIHTKWELDGEPMRRRGVMTAQPDRRREPRQELRLHVPRAPRPLTAARRHDVQVTRRVACRGASRQGRQRHVRQPQGVSRMKLISITWSTVPRLPGLRPSDTGRIECERSGTALDGWRASVRGTQLYLISPNGWNRDQSVKTRDLTAPRTVFGPIPVADVYLEWSATTEADVTALLDGKLKFDSDVFGFRPASIESDKPILAQIPPGQLGDA